MNTLETILAEAEKRGLRHVHFGLFDSSGHLAVKRSNVANLRKATTQGTNMVSAIFAAAPSGTELVLSNPLLDPDRGFHDGVLLMDVESCRDFPLESAGQGLLLLGEFVDGMGAYCARRLLRRELARWESLDMMPYGAFELECAMLQASREALQRTAVNDLQTRQGYALPYQLVSEPEDRAYLVELDDLCERMGVRLDAQHAELLYLLETSLFPERGMRIADNAGLYKNLAKHLARGRGFTASFMARWHHEHQGCGAHINLSIQDPASGANLFFDAAAPDRLSATLRHFVAGLHAFLPELFLLLAPNLNSYKRFLPGLFTPLNNTWGIDNKTVAYRVINLNAATARVEVRPAGADVSPHLGLLAVLVAGRMGIERALDPPAPTAGNGWAAEDAEGTGFPLTFVEAIERFASSEIARETLGPEFVEMFVSDRRWQIEQFDHVVTDWELRMFADGA